MWIETIWKATRSFVPIQLYPFLAPIYRRRRQDQLKQLDENDRHYLAAHPGLVVPPAELRYNVVGPCTIPEFLDIGQRTLKDIKSALRSVSMSLRRFQEFLDFGCGCGRLLLALEDRELSLRITGSDVDERAIRWCQGNLRRSTCVTNHALPPSPFKEDAFDLIWCGSVFTHLDENRQDRWLTELHRILKPGGILLASVHGPHCWESRLPPWTIARLKAKGIIFARTGADTGIHPNWYQVAWHTETYIRDHWGSTIEIRSYIPQGFNNDQDIIVARKGNESP